MADLTPLEQQQMALLEKLLKHQSENKLESYRPWPKQMEFHAAGKTHRERLFRAINQCQPASALISTPDGERSIESLIGAGEFQVHSWDGKERCIAASNPVVSAGMQPTYLVTLDDGKAFECSDQHVMLFESGWRTLDDFKSSLEINGVGVLMKHNVCLVGGRKIVRVNWRGKQEVFHFRVPGTDCYEASGVIHHNCGKSYAGAMEAAMHATGKYPENWRGHRFSKKTKGWAISESMQFSRDNAQRLLLGEIGSEGTGAIPKSDIVDIIKSPHSVAGTADSIIVKSRFGGTSKIMFKSAEVERNKLGGDTLDWAWNDEEPPYGHYEEVLTRTNIASGPVWTTFTPLRGSTNLVNRFLIEQAHGTADICWTIDDESHYTPEQKAAMREQYKNSPQRDARLYAKPVLGSGAVFPLSKDKISVDPFPIPDHWPRICGFDFGWTHPTAMAWWAIDRDTGIAYLYDVYSASEVLVSAHAAIWKSRGDWIRVAWPADGDNETMQGGGVALANQYRTEGVKMMMEPAMLPETNVKGEKVTNRKSVEAQIQLMNDDMAKGKLKVFSHLAAFWKEYDLYHRDENGKIVKKGEDILSAVRYGFSMRRFAKTRNEMNPVRIPDAAYSDRV